MPSYEVSQTNPTVLMSPSLKFQYEKEIGSAVIEGCGGYLGGKQGRLVRRSDGLVSCLGRYRFRVIHPGPLDLGILEGSS